MSKKELKISKEEAKTKIDRQKNKCFLLIKEGLIYIKKGYVYKDKYRDVFEIKYNLWVDFTFEILKEIFVSTAYAHNFKETKSSKVEYVNSSWIPDIKYYLEKQLSPKKDYLNILLENLYEFEEIMNKEKSNLTPMSDSRDRVSSPAKVFVVHGRNLKAKEELFNFLRALNLQPIEWSEAVALTGKGSPFIGEILNVAFSIAQAVVVLFTGDDLARLGTRYTDSNILENLEPQPRPNVLFEAGMAFGLHPDRTIIVQLGKIREISDISGRHIIYLNNSSKKKMELVSRLKTAKCEFDISHKSDWIDISDFEKCVLESDFEKSKNTENTSSTETFNLDENAIKVLQLLSIMQEDGRDLVEAERMDTALKMSVQKITYYLNKLVSLEFVNDHIDSEVPTKYSLAEKGLEYLVENDLIK